MARQEQDREDLLREATALVERIEFTIAGEEESITAGFRRQGCFGIYFGADPAYQFNTSGELRRAYLNGDLLTAEQRRLVRLSRTRNDRETMLVRHELSDEEQDAFLREAERRLKSIADALQADRYRILGQVPAATDVVARIRGRLATLPCPLVVAQSPNVQ